MGELFEKYNQMSTVKEKAVSEESKPAEEGKECVNNAEPVAVRAPRGVKRNRYAFLIFYSGPCSIFAAMQLNL